ncbi:hypothetical protein ACFFNY_04830 [Paenibacillus hodogayensis]|uniref:Uncharacterized protein n=1 Tax=Paenibacillus hodogayensis TaxID=279208 RepID=A0ABV5VRJ6_9BACL
MRRIRLAVMTQTLLLANALLPPGTVHAKLTLLKKTGSSIRQTATISPSSRTATLASC